mmetsp:Transcript_5515/g.11691  ORF Transcript_5515/g.11691 Transcript_5515/m.11691 type:complete len:131 (+) Transcript_5515:79-471(+)
MRRAASGNRDGDEANRVATPIAVAEAVGAASGEKTEIGRGRLPSLGIIATEATTTKAIAGKSDRITENQGERREQRRKKRKGVDEDEDESTATDANEEDELVRPLRRRRQLAAGLAITILFRVPPRLRRW